MASLAFAGAAFAAGVGVAWHHPLWPVATLIAFVLWFAVCAWRDSVWLLLLPAAMPLASLSPWTGWVVFDEFDLLLLGVLAGGYLRWALDATRQRPSAHPLATTSWPATARWLAFALVASSGLALYRGFADAAGPAFGWYQAHGDALNSLRLFKAPVAALLLWPLLSRLLQRDQDSVVRRLGLGMVAGMGVLCLAVLWERSAYPGLWDFSKLYRTTALFWEMHVGGAAIDAYLALAMPFVAWALWRARTPWQWAAAAVLALVSFYACLTTFSRGTYLAVGVSLGLLGLLLLARRLGFHGRALLRRALSSVAAVLVTGSALFVALEAFGMAGVVVLLLGMGALLLLLKRRVAGWRNAAALGLALALTMEVVAVFGTGNFMFNRLAATDRDFGGRLTHWQAGLGLLHTPGERLWGIGLGRLPASYARFVPQREFSGAVQWLDLPEGGGAARVSGPKTQPDLGGLFALTQRVPLIAGPRHRVEFDYRVFEPVELNVSVCEMHLLYDARCQGSAVHLTPASTSWQRAALSLRGPPLRRGDWYAPRLAVFAINVPTAGGQVDLRSIRLSAGASSEDLLANRDFSKQGARWLGAAQFYFVPWHIDNLYLEWLIERGIVGLAAFLALFALALRNLLSGPASRHPAAPFLAASLAGVLTLGLVSSVMDVPRVAFMFLLLTLLSLSLRAGADASETAP